MARAAVVGRAMMPGGGGRTPGRGAIRPGPEPPRARRVGRRAARAVSLAVSAVTAAAALAQSPMGSSTATMDVVSVDVYVTDASGKPLEGLGAQDFTLLVDGTPQEITQFSAPGDRPTAGGAEEASRAVSGVASLVVYVDEQGGRRPVRDRALHELAAILGGSPVVGLRTMLVNVTDRVRVLQRFEDDPSQFPARLEELAGISQPPSQLEDERNQLLSEMNRIDPDIGFDSVVVVDPNDILQEAGGLLVRIRGYAENLYAYQRGRMGVLDRFITSLSGLDGRTIVLYLGDGFETDPGWSLLTMWERRFTEAAYHQGFSAEVESGQLSLEENLIELVERANAGGLSFYSIPTGESRRSARGAAEGSGAFHTGSIAAEEQRKLNESLAMLSRVTGGAVLSTRDKLDDDLEGLLASLTDYYTIGFTLADVAEMAKVPIEITVPRSGVRTRHREYIQVKTLRQRIAETTYAAFHSAGMPNPLDAQVMLDGVAGTADLRDVTVMVTVPVARLGLVPDGDSHLGTIDVYYAVQLENGGVSNLQTQSLPVRIPNRALATALGQRAAIGLSLKAPAGRHDIAVTLRDSLSAQVSTVTLEFDVPGAGT